MKFLFFPFLLIFLFFHTLFQLGDFQLLAQIQSFEEEFNIANYPNQFLPNWYGNELRGSNSRIFQAKGSGINSSNSLAVQPISTFNGEVIVKLSPQDFNSPKVQFWSRSIKNGSGDRAALVYYSWSEKLENDYSSEMILGSEREFPNEDQEFRLFELEIPEGLKSSKEVFLRLEIKYGAGSGSCARWQMDSFEFGDVVEDLTAPEIRSVIGVNEKEIEVMFSESLDPIFSIIQLNYKLDGVEPEYSILNPDSIVTLGFSRALTQGKEYELMVSGIPDLSGNFLKDTLVNFTFYDPTFAPFKALVINELMPAPKADLDLPNVEYVELLNTAEYSIRTLGMSWSNSRTRIILPDVWIEPDELVLLVPANQAEVMGKFGKVIPINSWPTLLNAGDDLQLEDKRGNLIDKISYSSASWGESELANSGYSLEISNPFLDCDQTEFLKASVDPLKGTPGRVNSVIDLSPDTDSPFITEVEFIDSLNLLVQFSEPINFDPSTSNVHFQPDLEIGTIFSESSSSLFIQLVNPAQPSFEYKIEFDSVFDCSGNELEQRNEPIILPSKVQEGDVLINELLFDPKVGSPKFVELYNSSQKYLDFRKLKLANLDDIGSVNQIKNISEKPLILPPNTYLAITTDTILLKQIFPNSSNGNFFQISTLPSYPISGGTVVLMDDLDRVLEKFTYDEDLHHPLLRETKGVSLERVSSKSPAELKSNWQSASGNEDYGTPGKKNSQAFEGGFESDFITISPEVFDPESSNGSTFTTIAYQMNETGWIGTFEIFDVSGRKVEVLDSNAILGNSGVYTWEGSDGMGRKVRPGYYILMVELFDLQGRVKKIKKTIVVSPKF